MFSAFKYYYVLALVVKSKFKNDVIDCSRFLKSQPIQFVPANITKELLCHIHSIIYKINVYYLYIYELILLDQSKYYLY